MVCVLKQCGLVWEVGASCGDATNHKCRLSAQVIHLFGGQTDYVAVGELFHCHPRYALLGAIRGTGLVSNLSQWRRAAPHYNQE